VRLQARKTQVLDEEKKAVQEQKRKLKEAALRANGSKDQAKPLFSVPTDQWGKVKVYSELAALRGANVNEPWVLKSSPKVRTWAQEPAVSQKLTEFGATYRKADGYEETHWVESRMSAPAVIEATKEMLDACLEAVGVPYLKNAKDKDAVAAEKFSNSVWLYGCSPYMKKVKFAPAHGGLLMAHHSGEIHIVMQPLDAVVAMTKFKSEENTLGMTMMSLQDGEAAWYQQSQGSPDMKHVLLQPNDVLYIPQAHLYAAGTAHGMMVYGARRSVFYQTSLGVQRYEKALELTRLSNKPNENMQATFNYLQKGTMLPPCSTTMPPPGKRPAASPQASHSSSDAGAAQRLAVP